MDDILDNFQEKFVIPTTNRSSQFKMPINKENNNYFV